MAVPVEEQEAETQRKKTNLESPPIVDDDIEEEDDEDIEDEEDEDEEEEEEEPVTRESRMRADRAKMENLARRISTESVPLRVHDVLIKGNKKTKYSLIEAQVESIKSATTLQEILQAASVANARLAQLEIFDSVRVTLDRGPHDLPGTTNVVVEVVENKVPFTGEVGLYTKPQARSGTVEGSLKYKNLFGYGDIWDGSVAYGLDQAAQLSAGVHLPRFKALATPVMARVSLLSQDWLKFSSYKEQSLGLSLGLISSRNHDLAYDLSWRTLTDPSQMASRPVRRQLGHGLLSTLKYTFKVDWRNSPLRPTRGYAFLSTSQLGGLTPDSRSIRFFRQEFDLRYALPLGFYRAALNFGISGGVIVPWGSGFLNRPSPLPERFFLGGNSSLVSSFGSPTSLLGFKPRGLGPSAPKRELSESSNAENSVTSSGRDFIGGDLTVTAFMDLSFDFPLKFLREAGIHGHAFVCAGNLTKLTENAYQDFSLQKFCDSYCSSAGFGVVIPTKMFRMEVNYCRILRQGEHDRGKTGLQFCFSPPM